MSWVWFWFLVCLAVAFGYILRMVQVTIHEYQQERRQGTVWSDADWGGNTDPGEDVSRIRAGYEAMRLSDLLGDHTEELMAVTVDNGGRYEPRHSRTEPLPVRVFVHETTGTREYPLIPVRQTLTVRRVTPSEEEAHEHWKEPGSTYARRFLHRAPEILVHGP